MGSLLLQPALLDQAAQQELLKEVSPVFSDYDNEMIEQMPTKSEVKESVLSANLQAAPGKDGLTSFFYHYCWDTIGNALTAVVQDIHAEQQPTSSQRTSLMVFGCKPKKPKSTNPGDKRKISLLNSDFKIITGVLNQRLKKVATHTLSSCQLAIGNDRRIHHGINQARNAISSAGKRKQGTGILDNDYQAAFDFMVLTWVLQVLRAKGLSQRAIAHIENLYSKNFTIVVVNNVPGRKFENKRWSIRQGDRPSSILFCHGIDPHLLWLSNRLKGIDIYSRPVPGPVLHGDPFPLTLSETYKVIGYIDDVEPAITSLSEFSLVDAGSSLFEKASGCILHRNPLSGKVKFLPLGGWRSTLKQSALPVNYIVISEHLDMVGVELRATITQTRKCNGEKLVQSIENITGAWKGGKFMPLVLRGHSINTYCLSKLWFRCGSVDLKSGDINKMISSIKSWVYADHQIKPLEVALYRRRNEGGLGLINFRCRALAELIKTFLDTSVNPNFQQSVYHQALYSWHVLDEKSIPEPATSPYYSIEFYNAMKWIKQEGLIDNDSLSIKRLYNTLLEKSITNEVDEEGFTFTFL